MIFLVSGNIRSVSKSDPSLIGQLINPRCRTRILGDRPYAFDNYCFSGWDPARFRRFLEAKRGTSPLWVAVPDVVGDAGATWARYREWAPVVRDFGFPLAFVLQDGQEWLGVPWGEIAGVFVGGTTEFKLGGHVRYLVAKARGLGKHVHMGRVNSCRRIQYAYQIGCTSVDGSGPSRFTCKLGKFMRKINALKRQQSFAFTAPHNPGQGAADLFTPGNEAV